MWRRSLPALLGTALLAAPAAAPTAAGPTITVTPATVTYGHAVTVSGRFARGGSGQPVLVLTREFGQTVFSSVALVSTTAGGAWRFRTAPRRETTYKAQSAAELTPEALARVRPLVTLRSAHGGFLARVVSARSYERAFVLLQRRTRGHWRTLRRISLGKRPGTIHVRLPRGRSSLRVFLPKSQAGPGYLPTASRPIVVIR